MNVVNTEFCKTNMVGLNTNAKQICTFPFTDCICVKYYLWHKLFHFKCVITSRGLKWITRFPPCVLKGNTRWQLWIKDKGTSGATVTSSMQWKHISTHFSFNFNYESHYLINCIRETIIYHPRGLFRCHNSNRFETYTRRTNKSTNQAADL